MSRLRRLGRYVREMYPPLVMGPASLGSFLVVYLGLQALAGHIPLRITGTAAAGAVTVFLLGLLTRVYDELKDFETDRALARAGDPLYVARMTVTGDVTRTDLEALRIALTAVLAAINVPLGFPFPEVAFVGVFGLLWLSSRWFFYPRMSRHLLLAFATHNPLLLAVAAYAMAVYAHDFGSAVPPGGFLLLLGAWFPAAAWEVARKIRRPEDETVYPTYSKILGWRAAALVPAFFGVASWACAASVLIAAPVSSMYLWTLHLSAARFVGACLRFRLAPTREHARLRPFAEVHAVVVSIGLAAALAMRYGVRLG